MSECIFCQILAGKQPASMVYRDELCSAFMDIQPVNKGHLLVVPNQHAEMLADLDPPAAGHLFQVAQRLASALRSSGLRCEGVNLFLADGTVAGQEVPHAHVHVLPRYRGDGFGFRFGPTYGQRPPRTELDVTAAQIQKAVESQR